MAERPRVGITGPSYRGNAAWWFTAWAIWRSGGSPLRLQPHIATIPANLDAVVIGGGDDIDPVLYDEPGDEPDIYDAERDEFESRVIEFALTGEPIPLLGICRGAQLLNVLLGGTLYPDIRHLRSKTSNRDTLLPLKQVRLEQGSQLAATVGLQARVNSLHHQAINHVGRDLRIVARDSDGFVQAVERAHGEFLCGVQWHPEYLPYMTAQRRLFARLVQAARSHAREYPQS